VFNEYAENARDFLDAFSIHESGDWPGNAPVGILSAAFGPPPCCRRLSAAAWARGLSGASG